MTEYKKLSVLIPVYNEEKTIAEIIRRIQSRAPAGLETEIVVVDDGSKDASREILPTIKGIRYFFHEKNKGKGGALKTAIENATGDIMIIQDADLEYDPLDYASVIDPILGGQSEFVMGSRFLSQKIHFLSKDGSPFFSHYIGNKMIIALTNLLYRQNHTDYEGCYKAFTQRLIRAIPIETNGFDFDNELICKALRKNYKLIEVPIHYSPRLYAEGKKITWRQGVGILKTIIKWRFAKL